MKMKAKLLVGLLSLSMLFTGCGGNNPKSNDSSNSNVATNEEEGKKRWSIGYKYCI